MIACMNRSITIWKQGFYELLGSLYQQDVEERRKMHEAAERMAPVIAQGFLEFAFGPSKLEQSIVDGVIAIEPIDALNNIEESIPPESITKTQRVPRYPSEPAQCFIDDCLNYESPFDE